MAAKKKTPSKKKSKAKAKANARPKSRKKSAQRPRPKKRRAGVMGRPPLGTEDWTEKFLKFLAEGMHARDAARAANIDPSTPYMRRAADDAFKAAWQAAVDLGTEALEEEAFRRAFHGVMRPIYHKGEEVGHIREYSDQLMGKLLSARKPHLYRERFEHTGADGGNIGHDVHVGIYLPTNGRDEKPNDDPPAEAASEAPAGPGTE